MIKILCVAALALSAAPVSANPDPNPGETAQGAPVKEKKICKRKSSSLSRVPKQVCKTAAQWNNGADQGAEHSDLQRAGAR